MNEFKKELSSLNLAGSIVTVTGKKYNFSYSGTGIEQETQFYIGSLTKQMTAFMLLKVLQKHFPETDLSSLLEENITTLFPNSKLLSEIDKLWVSKISFLDLLTHRSGLHDYIDYYANDIKNPELLNSPINPIEILQSVEFNPSKKFDYSNTNYLLLGKLIEEIEDTSLNKVFDRFIKIPAQMDFSDAPIIGNYYALKDEPLFSKLSSNLNDLIFIDMSNAMGAGNVISSTSDLIKWNNFLHKQLSPEIKKIIFKNYCQDEDSSWINLGLSTEITRHGPLVGFQGGIDSYYSFLGYLPEHDLTIAILSNNQADFEQIMDRLEKLLNNSSSKDERPGFFNKQISYVEKMVSKTLSGTYWEM
ncbi:TPA: serine hydrolase domain-containing protein [Legionella pneumophila]